MRFGVSLPNVGDCGNPHTLVELAREAEQAGWDGVFVWDCIHVEIAERDRLPMADPWIATDSMTFLPQPVQSPRIPIWLDAVWPRMRSMRRAIQYDGIMPSKKNDDGTNGPMTPEDIRVMKAWIEEQRPAMSSFDILREGETSGDNQEEAGGIIQPFRESGVTWWIESVWTHFYRGTLESMRTRIRQGPPL